MYKQFLCYAYLLWTYAVENHMVIENQLMYRRDARYVQVEILIYDS